MITKPYTGDALKQAVHPKKQNVSFTYHGGNFEPKVEQLEEQETIHPYIPSEDIKKVVKMAQILRRPVLLRGEPGCGKTQLAKAVAYEWYLENYRQHFFEWYIKSNSKAQDGLFTFNYVEELRDANRPGGTADTSLGRKKYRELGALGKAFLASKENEPAVLLIDEIDKADIDFPNDLLLELDEKRFRIGETGEEITAAHSPVIFITSNQEKELPPAFLRRCLFLFIKFPQGADLDNIVNARFHEWAKDEQFSGFGNWAKKEFEALRTKIKDDVTTSKQVSTGELLDWMNYLILRDNDPQQKVDFKKLHEILLKEHKDDKKLPGYWALLKNLSDLIREKILEK